MATPEQAITTITLLDKAAFFPIIKYDVIREIMREIPGFSMADEFNECCRAYEAANQGFFAKGPGAPKVRYKEAGAFLANVSIKALFE